jgi:5-methylcytosine-specific restriction protein B
VTTNDEEFTLNGPNAEGRGLYKRPKFLVKAGSLARLDITPSAIDRVAPVHKRLRSEGILEAYGEKQLRFTQDYLFKTPSGASNAILATSSNGWILWKRADGATLAEVRRSSPNEQAPALDDSKRQAIIARHQQLVNEGKLPTQQQLDKEYALFRQHFGPSVLAGLAGEPLLTLMHDHTNRDSLVYWLEYKSDEEFDTQRFGGIGGGSALKYRIFRSKETGNWRAGGDNANQPRDISQDEAIAIAHSHRDQLLKGVELLEGLSETESDEEYAQLQDRMDELAPDVSRLGWGHKYFSLLFPNKLDDYHSPDWQRFHLLKLLQLPPEGDGRYICAGRFVSAAKSVGLSMNHFTTTLNAVHGKLHRYWRVGTTDDKTKKSFWLMMRDETCVAVGWPKTGDISWVDARAESQEKLKNLLETFETNGASAIGRSRSQLTQFVRGIGEEDVVLAANGSTILGIGRVVGGYEYHPEFDFPHQRQVEWLSFDEWQLPKSDEVLQSSVREIKKYHENILAIERRIQSPATVKPVSGKSQPTTKRPIRLSSISGRIQSILERKGQVVLYGPPGTGKTYWAERTANDLAALRAFGKLFDSLGDTERKVVLGQEDALGLVRLCCFHPAYGYEDFLEGYRPLTIKGQVSFELRDGVFKKLCKDASSSPERNFYLIVDEINRGDIPRIFGELLTTIEKDKRGRRIILPVSQEVFSVPGNVFLLGTMNTADRSISLLDAALRRRFGFVEMMPDGSVLKDSAVSGIALRAWLDALNTRIREHVGRDARNLQIGHSYLMHSGVPLKDVASLKHAIRDDIIPLLEEYCYEDYGTLGNILGEQIVDVAAARIRQELFDDGQEDALIQGLLAPFPEISTSSEAISSEESESELDEDDEGAES